MDGRCGQNGAHVQKHAVSGLRQGLGSVTNPDLRITGTFVQDKIQTSRTAAFKTAQVMYDAEMSLRVESYFTITESLEYSQKIDNYLIKIKHETELATHTSLPLRPTSSCIIPYSHP